MYPSFTNADLRLMVWVAEKDKEKRGGGEQYMVQRIDMEGCTLDGDVFTAEDAAELQQWIADFEKANPLVVVIFGDMRNINEVIQINRITEVKTVLLGDNPEAFAKDYIVTNAIQGFVIPQMYDGSIIWPKVEYTGERFITVTEAIILLVNGRQIRIQGWGADEGEKASKEYSAVTMDDFQGEPRTKIREYLNEYKGKIQHWEGE